jgi:hypothetical protein
MGIGTYPGTEKFYLGRHGRGISLKG